MNETIKTVRLYGALGARFGRVHRLAVASAAEAVRALCATVRGFEAHVMAARDRGVGFGVLLGKRHMKAEELRYPCGNADIRIAPVIMGSKQGGLFQIIIGAVLIVVGFVISPANPILGAALIQAGFAMVLGGIAQLLAPHPKGSNTKEKDEPNYSFSGIVNTQAQGNPFPLFYGGPKKVGSAVLSAGIVAVEGVYVPTPSAGGDGGLGGSGGVIAGSGGGGGGATGAMPV